MAERGGEGRRGGRRGTFDCGVGIDGRGDGAIGSWAARQAQPSLDAERGSLNGWG